MQTSNQTTGGNLPTTPNPNLFPELDLKVYVRILWHWSWLLILCTIVAGAGAYVFSIFSVPVYQASTTLLIDEARKPDASYQDLLTSERIARTYAELMQRETTLEKVAEQFSTGIEVLKDTLTDISVSPIRDTQLIKVTIEGISPEVVAAVADTLPQVFIKDINDVQTQRFAESKKSLEQQLATLSNQVELKQIEIDELGKSRTAEEEVRLGQLRNELAQYQNSYANILRGYEELRLTEVQSVDSVVVVEKANIPEKPIRPRTLINTLLAAVVGAMLALGIIFLIEYLDDRIKTPQDLYNVVNTPILGTIARIPHGNGRRKKHGELLREDALIAAHEPRHPITEAYRSLRTNLQFSSIDESLHSLVVTSATPGEGKTTTAANLAVVLAQSGRSVILIDADIRKPQQHKVFDLPKSPGLTDALVAGNAPLNFFLRETNVPNLRLLPSGKDAPNPAELLGSNRMKQVTETLSQEADIIIFDAPPVLAVTDAQVLANDVQGVLLVINTEKTPRAMIARAAEALMRSNSRLFGAVLNRLARSARGYYYYYDSYSYYYADDDNDHRSDGHKRDSKQKRKTVQSANPILTPQPQSLFDGKLVAQAETNGVYQVKIDPASPSKS
ncbi:MAG: polysaccharide biosynthesis tyrosine autokinase [Caldilineaceae bacterium]